MTSLRPPGAAATESEPAAPPRAELLGRARRLDWRILLPDTHLGHVAYLGPDDGRLVDALRAHSDSLVVWSQADVRSGGGLGSHRSGAPSLDGIVVRAAPLDAAPRLLALLSPGGWLYWELDRRRYPFATPARVARRLQQAGFESPRFHWHRPSFGDAVDILPLASPGLIAAALRRDSSSLARRALARTAGALHAAGLLERSLQCWSALARASGGPALARNAVAAFLTDLASRPGTSPIPGLDDPGSLQYSFRLPRFAASGHVIGFVHRRESASPALVVKVPRLAGDEAPVEREAAALEAVHAIRPRGFDSIPRLVAFERWRGSRWLVQTGLSGRPMTPAWVRRHEAASVAAVRAWLIELHTASRGEPLGPRGVARLLGEPLAAANRDDIAPLASRTLALAAPLAPLPAVFEHGDLAAPNLLLAPPAGCGCIGVVDWECADPHGLPGADLVFFLAFVASARFRARTPAEHAAAYRRGVLGSESARGALESYGQALGLPRAAWPAILAATWGRATLRARARAGDASPAAERPLALWRETLLHLDTLEP